MVDLFQRMAGEDVEQVIAVQHRSSGLRGWIVLHDTSLGPAVGGTRLLAVDSPDRALEYAIRFATVATHTLALAGLPAGGGAAVLIDHPGLDRAEALVAFGTLLRSLNGRFVSYRDEGLMRQDGWRIHSHCPWFADEKLEGLGDLEQAAALSVVQSILGALEASGQELSLRGKQVVLQRLAGRGAVLARVLAQAGADVTASDTSVVGMRVARELGVATVPAEELLELPADIVVLTSVDDDIFQEDRLNLLQGRIICDASTRADIAADQLREMEDLEILWVPGFLCNAGPLIVVAGHTVTGRKNWDYSILAMRETTRDLLRRRRDEATTAEDLAADVSRKHLRRPKKPDDFWLPAGVLTPAAPDRSA